MKHWVEFLHISVKEQPSTILAQYVTETLMDSLIHQRFPLPAKNDTSQAESELSYTEENALRYASGYVVRSVFEDIQKQNHDSQSTVALKVHFLSRPSLLHLR